MWGVVEVAGARVGIRWWEQVVINLLRAREAAGVAAAAEAEEDGLE